MSITSLPFKTRFSPFDALAARVTELHPYEIPGILGIEAASVNKSYHTWLIYQKDG